MTSEQHKKRHKELHEAVDELLADYITHHPNQQGFTTMPVIQLITWSAKMVENPDHEEEVPIRSGRGFLK